MNDFQNVDRSGKHFVSLTSNTSFLIRIYSYEIKQLNKEIDFQFLEKEQTFLTSV
jgi:hypothetical protein